MRLARIEAVRYGRLRDAVLGELGDGLTVVSGPNEAGKSTFTALVRHVLYGYPTAREKEAGYHVAGDGRLARLVFAEDDGTWVVERAEGTHGGDVRVRALSGPGRPGLLADVTRGVSTTAYQVVFGFGLDEMARIEELHSSGESIIAPLYAASAGLTVSPHVVRAAIEREAAELFKPSGRKPVVNTLVSELRSVRGQIRDLRTQADTFKSDQERLRDLSEQLESAREAREQARTRATELALASESAQAQLDVAHAQDEALIDLRRARKEIAGELERIEPDEALLAAAPELDALLDEAAAFTRDAEALADANAKRESAAVRAEEARRRTGITSEPLGSMPEDHVLVAAVEEARDELQRLALVRESRDEESARVAAARASAAKAANGALAALGIPLEGAAETIADRLAAIEHLDAVRDGGGTDGRPAVAVAAVFAVAGLAAVVGGIVLEQWISTGVGALALVVGLWLLWRAWRGASALPTSGERSSLEVAGLDAGAGAIDVSRLRRSLENARQLVGVLADADARLEEAERDAALARDALATRQSLWSGWLAGRGLDPTLAPTAAVQVIALLRDARAAADDETEAAAQAERIAARLDAYTARLAAAARPHVAVPEPMSRDDVGGLVNRLRERLVTAREAEARRSELARDLAAADSRIASEEQRLAAALGELTRILARFDLAEGGTHDDLRAMRITAEREALEADASFDSMAQEKNQLEGRLATSMGEQRSSELALAEAGLAQRLADATDRYLVLACASRLLAGAQERYERERQPEVVQSAQRIFSQMTHDRYTGLSVPLGDDRIEVFGAHAEAKTSDVLSRGTAEQLYLALRLGLIAQLGDVGPGLPVLMDDVLVNFDPERKRGAAEAVAELARGRQVVFFTCHPETARLFSEVAPEHTRIELGRCEL